MLVETRDLQKKLTTIYTVLAVSGITQFFEATEMLGLLLLFISYIQFSSKKLKQSLKGNPLESHLTWISRTFWFGTTILLPGAMLLALFIAMKFTDAGNIMDMLKGGGDGDAMMNNVQGAIESSTAKISKITKVCMLPPTLWWLLRCWNGYNLAQSGEPVDDPTRMI